MNDLEKERLLDQFRHYLDGIGEEADEPLLLEDDRSETDLLGVFVELAALRSEVRGESRQVKDALDQFRAVFAALESNQSRLEQELARHQAEAREREQALLRPLLLAVLELRDRLVAGLAQPQRSRDWLARLRLRRPGESEGFQEGLAIMLRRLDRILSERRVLAIDVIGRKFDPRLARAVGTRCDRATAAAIVVEEVRAGFLWGEDVLRVAEVIVNAEPGERAS